MRGQTAAFETLESRQLLSTVNVVDFGAKPNDGVDDSAAVQRAIDSSRAGDTIVFPSGTFDISGLRPLTGDRIYRGAKGAVLHGHTANGEMLDVTGDDVTITGLTFDGGGIFLDKTSGFNQNIVIDNNIFRLNTTGTHPNGVTFTSGLRNSKITNNYFTNYTGVFGIYGYNYYGLTIANNEFVNINAGIHIDAFGGSGNLLVEQNYITGVHGMGMEFQTQGTGTDSNAVINAVFQDNWYENPNLSSNKASNTNSMAFSLILDRGTNEIIRRNVVIAPQRPDGIGTRIGFEVGGDNTLVQDNYIDGVNQTVAVNDGRGTCSVTVENNKFQNYLEAAGLSFPAPGRTWKNINNGPNATLSSTMVNRLAKHVKPGRNKRYQDNGTRTSASAQTAQPAVASPGGSAVYLSNLQWLSATSGWGPVEKNQSAGGRGPDDGTALSINGRTYKKGLGAAIDSQIVYNLDGKYTTFLSDIGVDDQAGKKGSVQFQVWADGELIYQSGVLHGTDPAKKISLNVASVKQLKLVTTAAGDGGNSDLADWAGARLLTE